MKNFHIIASLMYERWQWTRKYAWVNGSRLNYVKEYMKSILIQNL